MNYMALIIKRYRYYIALVALIPCMVACQHVKPVASIGVMEEKSATSPAKVVPQPPKRTDRPFTRSELQQALLAEMHIAYAQYAQSLRLYTQLADRTQDLAVLRRTVQIAQFLRDRHTALKYARIWTQQDPYNTEAIAAYGAELLNHKNIKLALHYARKLIELGSTAKFNVIVAIAKDLPIGKRTAIYTEVKVFAKQHSENKNLQLALAMCLADENKIEQAIDIILPLLHGSVGMDALLFYTSLLEQQQEWEKLQVVLNDAVEEYPDHNYIRYRLAKVLVNREEREQAKPHIDHLRMHTAYDLQWKKLCALLYWKNNNHSLAAQLFESMLYAKYDEDLARYYLGQWYEEKDNVTKALNYYSGIQKDSHLALAVAGLIEHLTKSNVLTQHTPKIWDFIVHHPKKRTQLYTTTIESLLRINRPQIALTWVTEFLQHHPQDIELLYLRGSVYEKQGKIELMEKDWRQALTIQFDNPKILNALGYALTVHTQRYDESAVLIRRALQLQPKNAAILDSMGWVLYHLGDLQKSLHYLQRAFSLLADHEIAAHMGEVLWKMKQYQKARSVWSDALTKSPNSNILHKVIFQYAPTLLNDRTQAQRDHNT